MLLAASATWSVAVGMTLPATLKPKITNRQHGEMAEPSNHVPSHVDDFVNALRDSKVGKTVATFRARVLPPNWVGKLISPLDPGNWGASSGAKERMHVTAVGDVASAELASAENASAANSGRDTTECVRRTPEQNRREHTSRHTTSAIKECVDSAP
jgi:hypothetical protein